MDDKRHDGQEEDPEVIDRMIVKRIDREEVVEPRRLDDEKLEAEADEEGEPEHLVRVGEDEDERLLDVGHAKHVEEFREGQDREGHGLRFLELLGMGGEVVVDGCDIERNAVCKRGDEEGSQGNEADRNAIAEHDGPAAVGEERFLRVARLVAHDVVRLLVGAKGDGRERVGDEVDPEKVNGDERGVEADDGRDEHGRCCWKEGRGSSS